MGKSVSATFEPMTATARAERWSASVKKRPSVSVRFEMSASEGVLARMKTPPSRSPSYCTSVPA